MKLHLSGVKLPKLGTIQDRVYRDYLTKEAQLEGKRTEMVMLLTLTNPTIQDPSKQREWQKAIKGVWSDYLSLLYNIELPKQTEQEMEMLEYYQSVVKKAQLKLFRNKQGKLQVSGIERLLRG